MFVRALSWAALVGFLGAVTAPPAAAEPPAVAKPLKADPADKNLVIRGVLTPTVSTFAGSVSLTAPDKGGKVRLRSSDLIMEGDPNVVIDRAKVTIPDVVNLGKDEPQSVRVSVGPVTRPGVYTGILRFHLDGSATADEEEVALRLVVHAQVSVKAIPETATAATARAGWADALLPARLTGDRMVVLLDNLAEDAVVKDIDVYLQSETTKQVVGADVLKWEQVKDLPAGKATRLELTYSRSNIPPDQYKGRVRVRVERAKESMEVPVPISVPLDLSVRVGPLWPVMVVVFGILLGRGARSLATPAGQMQLELYPRLVLLQTRAARIADPAVKARIMTALDAVGRRIDQATEPKDAIVQTMVQLGNEIEQALNGGPVGLGVQAQAQNPPTQFRKLETAVIAFLTGLQPSSARFKLYLQLLVSTVLLVALVFLGLQTLYFTSGATFGVNGVYDYFALFIWGVSSEVAQRTLLQLGPKA